MSTHAQREEGSVPASPEPHPPPLHHPRWLYLHGFASGPGSKKGVAIASHYEQIGVPMERLNLRLPSFERLRLSAMIQATRSAIGGERDRAVLFGSSLGGLTASRVAEADARVFALVLLAPALNFPARWRAHLGEEKWLEWERGEWLSVHDHVTHTTARVDFGFARDAAEVDERAGGPWPDVRVPTLIIHGRRDETVDINLSRTWSAGKRHVRLVEVDDGHELTSSLDVITREADAFLAPLLG